jgi:hypothetical protein
MIFNDLIVKNDNQNCTFQINGKKVDLSASNILKSLKDNLKNDSGRELLNLFVSMPKKLANEVVDVNKKEEVYSKDVDEVNKLVYGIKIGKTTRIEVKNKFASVFKVDENEFQQVIKELGLFIFYDDKDTVQEIILESPFNGITLKGLKIGDTIDKASEIYGQPKIKSLISAFWKDFSVFLKNDIITSIKLR